MACCVGQAHREEESICSGVYFCRLQAGYEAGIFSQVRRMMLLK